MKEVCCPLWPEWYDRPGAGSVGLDAGLESVSFSTSWLFP